MPRTVFDEAPQIDWLLAAILERKMHYHYEWSDIAAKAHVNPDVLRKYASQKHTSDWNSEMRRSVCRALGISQRMVISAGDKWEVELR